MGMSRITDGENRSRRSVGDTEARSGVRRGPNCTRANRTARASSWSAGSRATQVASAVSASADVMPPDSR